MRVGDMKCQVTEDTVLPEAGFNGDLPSRRALYHFPPFLFSFFLAVWMLGSPLDFLESAFQGGCMLFLQVPE